MAALDLRAEVDRLRRPTSIADIKVKAEVLAGLESVGRLSRESAGNNNDHAAVQDDAEFESDEAGNDLNGHSEQPLTPSSMSRRNKRKMTEPRRRPNTDFSIRSICSSSNSDDVDVDKVSEYDDEPEVIKRRPPSSLWLTPDVLNAGIAVPPPPVGLFASGGLPLPLAAFNRNVTGNSGDFLCYPLNIPMLYQRAAAVAAAAAAASMSTVTATSQHQHQRSSSVTSPPSSTGGASVPSSNNDDDDRPSPPSDVIVERVRNKPAVRSSVGVDASRSKRKRALPNSRRVVTPALASAAAAAGSSTSTSPVGSDESSNLQPLELTRSASATSAGRASKFSRADVVGDPPSGTSASTPQLTSPSRKNYKNMTKQRRIEANARERTRVHTISAAFESLRRAVPSYSYNQRLSKLAILRIACSYILALARLADLDYGVSSGSTSGMTFADCVDMCTQTIQTEGKAKRRH